VQPWLRDTAKELLHACLRERFLWRLPVGRRAIALTFDDGPHPDHTPAVLDVLAKEQARATFFVLGQNVARYPHLVRRIAAEGHALGGHTFHHQEIPTLSSAALARELEACRGAIQDAAGIDTRWFRPPRGRMSATSLRRVLSFGYRVVHWTRTYGDYQQEGTQPLLRRMAEVPARARDIVLLHDHNPFTVEALAAMLPSWRARGLELERL
jgi:peptidoglycan/xylan/chitin deacetylase (PgdA/CDA1 family)